MKHDRLAGCLKDEFLWPVLALTAMLSLMAGLGYTGQGSGAPTVGIQPQAGSGVQAR
jgi:hypothetical protein